MKRLLPLGLLLIGTLWLGGCMLVGPDIDRRHDGADFPLRTEHTAYAPGDSVALSLANHTGAPVSFNLCSSTLERRADGDWDAQPADFACTLELRVLAPGATDTFPYPLAETLAEGRYRFTTRVELFEIGESRVLTSNTFRVR